MWLNIRDELFPENALLDWIPEESWAHLKLPPFIVPRIYSSLPREQGRVKSNFSNLFKLKKHWVDRLLLSLYSNVEPKKASRLVIFNWVMPPGRGDARMAQAAVEKISARYPQLELHLITIMHAKSAWNQVSNLALSHPIIYHDRSSLHWKTFSEKLLSLLSSAVLILQLPTFYPHTASMLKRIGRGPRHECLGEYGFIDSPHFHLGTKNRCMGLHFLEKGIMIKAMRTGGLESLNHKKLLEHLIGSASPTKNELLSYKLQRCLYFGYLLTEKGHWIYLNLLLSQQIGNQKGVDVCITSVGYFLKDSERLIELCKNHGIGQLTVVCDSLMSKMELKTGGKALKIVEMPSLSQEDFSVLAASAEPFFGCRGDQSFSEAVAGDKLFFYDYPLHSLPFLSDLKALAEQRIAEFPSALVYLQVMQRIRELPDEEIVKELKKCLENPETEEGLKRLAKIIRLEHRVNEYLENLVGRAFSHFARPHLQVLEQRLLKALIEEKMSLEMFVKNLTQAINE